MGFVLFLVGGLALFFAAFEFTTATTAPQQIFAAEVAIVGAVLIAGGCVVDAVDKLRKAIGRALETWAKSQSGE